MSLIGNLFQSGIVLGKMKIGKCHQMVDNGKFEGIMAFVLVKLACR